MKFHGPLVTLAAGALTGGTLLAMSVHAARPQDANRTAAVAAPASVGASVASPAGSPTPGSPAAEPALTPAAGRAVPDASTGDGSAAADEQPGTGDLAAYAGRLKGGRYALVLAVNGDRAVGYLCDGDRVEAWFRGTASRTELRLADPAGERLVATLRPGRARGDLDALGTHWSFDISAVEPASVKTVTAKVAP